MPRRGTNARFAVLLAIGAAACAGASAQPQPQGQPQSSATVVAAPPAPEEPKYAMLVALPGDASDWPDGGPPPTALDAVRRMNDPDSGPPPEQRGLHCTCHPAAFAPTAYQREALGRIRKFAEQFRAAGNEAAAAVLQRQTDETEKAAQAKCVAMCATQ